MNNSTVKSTYRFNGFILDVRRRSLQSPEGDIPLSPKEFLTLLVLVDAAGNAVERETIIAAVWPDTAVGDTSLARNISSLRKHLGSGSIESLPKFGYRFALPVSVVASPETAVGQNASLQVPANGSALAQPATVSAGAAETSGKPVSASPDTNPKQNPGNLGERPQSGKQHLYPWSKRVVIAAIAAALVTLAAIPLASSLLEKTAPTWTDPQTKLIWARRDNGKDVNREGAIAYCQSLDLAGHRDWRLPAIDEVQTLFDPAISIAGVWGLGSRTARPVYWHVKGNVYLTGGTSASDLTFDGLQEQSYDCSYGRRNFDPPDFHWDHRALCVRGVESR